MSRHAWMLAGLIVAAGPGCVQQHQQIVRFHQLDKASTVELVERDAGSGTQETRAVLNEPGRIQKIAHLVNSPGQWQSFGKTPREARYAIVFRHADVPTQTFHFEEGYLGTSVTEDDARARPFSAAETKAVLSTFHFPSNSRSP